MWICANWVQMGTSLVIDCTWMVTDIVLECRGTGGHAEFLSCSVYELSPYCHCASCPVLNRNRILDSKIVWIGTDFRGKRVQPHIPLIRKWELDRYNNWTQIFQWGPGSIFLPCSALGLSLHRWHMCLRDGPCASTAVLVMFYYTKF